MHEQGFDQLTRQLAAGASRRDLLRGIGWAALSGLLTLVGCKAPEVNAPEAAPPSPAANLLPTATVQPTASVPAATRTSVPSPTVPLPTAMATRTAATSPVASPTHAATPTALTGTPTVNSTVTGCDSDVPTITSLQAAQKALDSGANEVPLSPGGCFRYKRTVSNGHVTTEETSLEGKPVSTWLHTATLSNGQRDADRDGFFEWHAAIKRGSSPNDQRVEQTWFSPATQKAVRRKTYTRANNTLRVVTEEAAADGTLRTVNDYDVAVPGTGKPVARTGGASLAAMPLKACPPLTQAEIEKRLEEAFEEGLRCLRDHDATDIMSTLLTVHSNGIEVVLDDIPNLIAYADWWTPWWERWNEVPSQKHGRITVDPKKMANLWEFPDCTGTTAQKRTLFHEMMHFHFGEHDPRMQDDLDPTLFSTVDPGNACANMCFLPAGVSSRCDCARCLSTNTCDKRCKPYRACETEQLGFQCPCTNKNGKYAMHWFPKCSECLSKCPTGLACAGYSSCKVLYVGCDPKPPTCPS